MVDDVCDIGKSKKGAEKGRGRRGEGEGEGEGEQDGRQKEGTEGNMGLHESNYCYHDDKKESHKPNILVNIHFIGQSGLRSTIVTLPHSTHTTHTHHTHTTHTTHTPHTPHTHHTSVG